MIERLARNPRYNGMLNRAMRNKLERKLAIDLSPYEVETDEDRYYVLPDGVYKDGVDYCNAQTERWIWSIGRDKQTARIFAAEDARFYQNPDYDCLWLR